MSTNPHALKGSVAFRGVPSKGRWSNPSLHLSVTLAPLVRRFIAGTTLRDALRAVRNLHRQGFLVTLNHLGGCAVDRGEAKNAADHCIVMLNALKERRLERNITVKPSRFGLSMDKELCITNLQRIIDAAEEVGGYVRVDAEGSDTIDDTLEIVGRIRKSRNTPIGIALEAMLKRTPDDIISILEKEISICLRPGTNKEPGESAYQRMRDIKREFLADAKRLITSGICHGIATDDVGSIGEIASFARAQGISPDEFEFQMPYGIRRSFQKKLLREGWRVRIHVPFGRLWLPCMIRRIRERRKNTWFSIRGLFY